MRPTRRGFITRSAGLVSAATAGCLAGSPGGGRPTGRRAQASFYLLYDLARAVAGDDLAVESIVPFGQHGHGWDGPTAGQRREIATSDLFVYMGDDFQPWADDVVAGIREDGADVRVVSARDGIPLLDRHDGGHHEHETANDDAGEPREGGNDHDPHFWLDPRRTGQAVGTIRDGMIAIDPANEAGYRDRTESALRDLEDLHAAFAGALSDAGRDAVFVAGHNAFRYLGAAYGFEVFGLTGISPDEGVSASARRDAERVIDDHDIEHVLHPVLEPRGPAEQLVADTAASTVLDVTSISGVTDEWIEADRGYVDLMRSINLPSFTEALGAE